MLGSLVTAALAALSVFATIGEAAPADAPLSSRQTATLKFGYGVDKVRGVNLGGWFVLEPWITPSIFSDWSDGNSVKDEYMLCEALGKDEAYRRLSEHWHSFITQDDFGQIAAAGMNHVRIPIGYWSIIPIDGEPFVQGAYDVLAQALDWAQAAGLKVMIDLHGAPGSQNGFDNSGRFGSINWGQGDTVQHTLNVINKIRDDHASHPAVSSIELVNEPMAPVIGVDKVRQFYNDGWGNLKDAGVAIAFHDAFMGVNSWNDWGDGLWNLLLDTHHYEIFDNEVVAKSPADHVGMACAFGGQMRANNKWTISGEWTGAMTDCAKWLNGLGKGARYDGTFQGPSGGSSYVGSCDGKYQGSVDALSAQDKENIGRYIEAQLDAYESASGWIFWTWKTESAPEWDMQELMANNIFPSPVTRRNYPGQCGGSY